MWVHEIPLEFLLIMRDMDSWHLLPQSTPGTSLMLQLDGLLSKLKLGHWFLSREFTHIENHTCTHICMHICMCISLHTHAHLQACVDTQVKNALLHSSLVHWDLQWKMASFARPHSVPPHYQLTLQHLQLACPAERIILIMCCQKSITLLTPFYLATAHIHPH